MSRQHAAEVLCGTGRARFDGLSASNAAAMHPPVHPGEVLAEEFLAPLGMSAKALAKAIEVSPVRVSHIIAGRRAITADTALRFARYFGTTAQVWRNLQMHYDLETASRDMG